MKYVTSLFMISLICLFSCSNDGDSAGNDPPVMNEEELKRVTMLIDPAPKTYQEDQVNKLIQYALDHDWPVHKTGSGLLYWIRKQGDDSQVKKDDTVQVRYKGNLIDGKIFDQSPPSGEPAEFNVRSVIPAWQEALSLIGEGGQIVILAHSDLAYRGRRMGNAIPPYSPLIFEIELINVNIRD
ncbi:MAG TPA: FKBP-type peptidyl-prolyl cis-trans isomerase [Membranihabitans sp.]|nr:FKBP-type peptidyl-prolyl cis-trans isomerase [Membranihabitans sp.]